MIERKKDKPELYIDWPALYSRERVKSVFAVCKKIETHVDYLYFSTIKQLLEADGDFIFDEEYHMINIKQYGDVYRISAGIIREETEEEYKDRLREMLSEFNERLSHKDNDTKNLRDSIADIKRLLA